MDTWDLFAEVQTADDVQCDAEGEQRSSVARKMEDEEEGSDETEAAKSVASGKLLLNEDPEAAVGHLEAAARRQSAQGHRLLAMCQLRGHGTDVDADAGHRSLEAAARLGDGPAALMLAREKLALEHYADAVPFLRTAADGGLAEAMAILGDLFMGGYGSDDEAFELYMQAADEGCARAMNGLVMAYSLGRGTAVDEEEAVAWAFRAADAGNLSFAAERLLCANSAFSRAEGRARRSRRTERSSEPGWGFASTL